MVLLLLAVAALANDHHIRSEAVAAVNRYAQFTIFDDVSVTVQDGFVTLSGKVTHSSKKNDLARLVEGIATVRAVDNRITVLPDSPSDDALRGRIAQAIYGNASFWSYAVMPNPPIHIIVEHGRVTLTGVVRTDADRALAGALALQAGARSVTVLLRTEAESGLGTRSADA